MKAGTYSRLSLMMILQYAVWGAWLPVLARYLYASPGEGGLGFSWGQIGMIIGLAGSVGALTAPFIGGQVADRYFNAERALALLVGLGGVVKWVTAYQTTYAAWLWLSILYSVLYMPTLALTNSLAFAHLEDAEKEFPYVRVWGTIGWILASWVFPMIWLQTDLKFQWAPPFLAGDEVPNVTSRLVDALKFSGMIAIGYAVFCFLLPRTPPKRNAVEPLAFVKAFALLKKSSFAVLVVASLAISVIHQIYFIQTGEFLVHLGLKDSHIGPAMTIAQVAEILVMALLGVFLKRFGFRTVIFVGCISYFLRYLFFGTESLPLWLIVVSQALHGLCYACFFAAAYIYVEEIAEEDIRHSAQTVFAIVILGFGPVLGGFLAGHLGGKYTTVHAFSEAQAIIRAGTSDLGNSPGELTASQLRLRKDFARYAEDALGKETSVPEAVTEKTQAALLKIDETRQALGQADRQSAASLAETAAAAIAEAEDAIMAAIGETERPKTFRILDFPKFWYTLAAIGLITSILFVGLFKDETKRTVSAGEEEAADASREEPDANGDGTELHT